MTKYKPSLRKSSNLAYFLDSLFKCSDLDTLLEMALKHICSVEQIRFANIIYFDKTTIVPLAYAYKDSITDELSIYVDSWLLDITYSRSIMKVNYPKTHKAFTILLNDGNTNIGLLYLGLNLQSIPLYLLPNLYTFAKVLAIKLKTSILQNREAELLTEINRIQTTNKENIRFLYDVSKQLYAITAISTYIAEGPSSYTFFKKIESKIIGIFACHGMLIFWKLPARGDLQLVFKSYSIRKRDFALIYNEIMKKTKENNEKAVVVDLLAEHSTTGTNKEVHAYKRAVLSPLSIKGAAKGYLVLLLKDCREYANDTMRLLSGISSIIAAALENLFLYDQTKRERSKLRFLLDSISHFSETLDLGETLRSIVKAAAPTLGSKGTIFLLSRSTTPLVVLSKNRPGEEKISVYETIEDSVLRYLLRYFEATKRAMLIRDLGNTQRLPFPIIKGLKPLGIYSLVGVPLKLRKDLLGVLLLCSGDKNKRFSVDDVEIAKGLADAAAISLRNSQIYSSAQDFSAFLEKKIAERAIHPDQLFDRRDLDLENAHLLVFRLNLKGYFIFVNRTMELKTGYDRELFYTGKINPLDLVVPEDRYMLKSTIRSILKGNVDRVENKEFAIINSRNEKLVLQMNMYPDKDPNGRILGLEAVCNDITVKKLLEAEIAKSKELALLGEFSSAIAHQIRTPLSQIYVALRRMQMALKDKSTSGNNVLLESNGCSKEAEFIRLIDEALENSKDLERMITDVLNYTKTLKLSRTIQSLEQILKEVVDDFLPIASKSNIVVSLDGSGNIPPADVDALLLGQAFRNIIHNAIEAMPEGGYLHISQGVVQAQGKYARIAFKDTGKGIPKEHLDKIFHPFFTTKPKGTGLGLSFASRVIAAHGGSIWAESDGKKGTTIVVLLPLQHN